METLTEDQKINKITQISSPEVTTVLFRVYILMYDFLHKYI